MAWQMFVALNWRSDAPDDAADGLAKPGMRVWQTWRRVEDVFGPGPVRPACANPSNLPVFTIASDGKGNPSARNEEYFQASTNLPLIDVNGNWTIFERRLNDVEIHYLENPIDAPGANLTTLKGQRAFLRAGGKVAFPEGAATPTGRNGAMEVKAAWRIIVPDKGDDPTRYFIMRALLQVSGELVNGQAPICEPVTLGLVGMHIIQKNPVAGKLLNQWIWASFEHIDNAPLAKSACDPTGEGRSVCVSINKPSCGPGAPDNSTRYSYFDRSANKAGSTNVPPVASKNREAPAFQWSKTQPYARPYQQTPNGTSPQAVRCWSIYSLTDSLNVSWRTRLQQTSSPFANYMLIGTQWGGNVEPVPNGKLPNNAVPGLLSNITLETYIQNYVSKNSGAGIGSCISCHANAALAVSKMNSDFSFLPSLAEPMVTRRVRREPK